MKIRVLTLGFSLATLAASADLPEMKARGTLRVIAAADEQPETFSFKAGTEPGFERELLEAFARLQGLTLETVPARSYADRIPMLVAGQGDVIAVIFDTEERRKQVNFTAEVMPTHNVVVTLRPTPVVMSMDQLRGQRIGVVAGTASVEDTLAAGVPASSLVKLEDGEAALAALRDGKISAAIRPVSEFSLSVKRDKRLQAGMVVGPRRRSAWGVRKEDIQLRRALDDYLGNVRRGATWGRLMVKYFGDHVLDVLGRKP